ncbi:hypothetical protein GS934_17150 [Rhodococcus hoagii]|nr:hypothetical protein [Prescottella equi]NKZ88180.1 hypothetical protein [Prescottella equi]
MITVPGLRADAAAFLGHLLVVAVPDARDVLALDPATGDLLHEQDVDARAHSCIRIRREIRPYSSSPWDRTAYSPTA